jgi:hypothetical protein
VLSRIHVVAKDASFQAGNTVVPLAELHHEQRIVGERIQVRIAADKSQTRSLQHLKPRKIAALTFSNSARNRLVAL